MKYTASCSFAKDSLAMVFMLIEKGYPLEEVVFYDTGMEFQAIYNLRDKIKPLLEQHGIKYVELKPLCRTSRPMKGESKSIFDLEKRFELEKKLLAQGKSIKNREFYEALKIESRIEV